MFELDYFLSVDNDNVFELRTKSFKFKSSVRRFVLKHINDSCYCFSTFNYCFFDYISVRSSNGIILIKL